MRKKIRILLFGLFSLLIAHNSSAIEMNKQSIAINVHDKARLQRGATLFMNYCSGCHSLKYMRYNRMAEDLGFTDFAGKVNENLLNNLIFTRAALYDPIQIAMPLDDAKQWFGIIPPDLSLSAREKGAIWLYHYLKSFYNDNAQPFGVNNLLVPNVAMPNSLEPLMGQQVRVLDNETHRDSLVLIKQGQMSPMDFENCLSDLVTFLVYVSEPAQLIRYQLGIFVIIFLGVLFIAVYVLKRIYWRRLVVPTK
jgi:ubiquinol-cytochrome c reductase cytochrome c1 subunit